MKDGGLSRFTVIHHRMPAELDLILRA